MTEKEDRPAGPPALGERMNCEEFQEQLPQLIEDGVYDHPHLRTCQRCTALLRELEEIADAAKQLLPLYEPPDKVWLDLQKKLGLEDDPAKLKPPSSPPQSRQ